jgi:cytochrome c oxidase subunit 2
LYGADVKLADGTTVVADDAYLAESILDPKAKEVDGYSPTVMPPFALTEDEISNIIAYFKTLK